MINTLSFMPEPNNTESGFEKEYKKYDAEFHPKP
jgi:hypothetical protein